LDTVNWLTWNIPRWALMWGIAVTLFAAFKTISFLCVRTPPASAGRKLAYLFLWPGMDAAAFLSRRPVVSPTPSEWGAALLKTAAGIALLAGSRAADAPLLRGWIAMIGILLSLHFGFFHGLSCFWRSQGIDAAPLMNRPLAATSVSAFWSRHWNTAFRDLTYHFVFRPLLHHAGARGAVLGTFMFSGLLHELAITVPAGGGYGGPTLFFMLQGSAMILERSHRPSMIPKQGWFFTQGLLVLTLPLLVLPPFVLRVINPFVDFLHGLVF